MICGAKLTNYNQVKSPARLDWHEACLPKPRRRQVTKVAYYYLSANAMTRPMQVRVRRDEAKCGKQRRTGEEREL